MVITRFVRVEIVKVVQNSSDICISLLRCVGVLDVSFPQGHPTIINVRVVTICTPSRGQRAIRVSFFTLSFGLLRACFVYFGNNSFVTILGNSGGDVGVKVLNEPFFQVFRFQFR